MTEIKEITLESTKEEIAEYLGIKFKISENTKKRILEEDINGEILFSLEDNELKLLEMKAGQIMKVKKFISENKEKFNNININEKITDSSNTEEVKAFFDKNFNYKGDLKGLNGKGLLELSENEIKNFGFTLGKRKKLIKYINFFKKEQTNKSTSEIQLSKDSSQEEVTQYLKEKLQFSDKSIGELELDGEGLFLIEKEEDIDLFDIEEEEKEKLKELLKKLKNPIEKEEEKEDKKIDIKSNKEEALNFLKLSLQFSDDSLKKLKELNDLDGQYLLLLDDDEIDELEIDNEDKNNLKEFLKKEKGKIQDLNKILNINYNPEESIDKNYYPLKNIKTIPILTDAKYNIFFFVYLDSNIIDNLSISTYIDKNGMFNFSKKYKNYKPFALKIDQITIKKVYDKIYLKSILFQIPSNKYIPKLSITIKDIKTSKEYNAKIEIKKGAFYYFNLSDLSENNSYYSIFESQNNYYIIFDYFNYFFNNKIKEIFQKNLLKSIISKINKSKDGIDFNIEVFLRFFKYCLKFNLEPKNIERIHLDNIKSKTALNKEFFLSNEEINQFTNKNKKEKEKIIKLFIEIYANNNKDYLMDLIQSNNSKEYGKVILSLLVQRTLKVTDFSFKAKEFIPSFQKNLLSISQSKDEINLIIKISENLSKSIEFIGQNYNDIYTKLDKQSSYLINKAVSYLLTLPQPKPSDDLSLIYQNLYDIFTNKHKESKYKIIDLEELFGELIDYYKTKSLEDLGKLKHKS